jgi:hypothetical protein
VLAHNVPGDIRCRSLFTARGGVLACTAAIVMSVGAPGAAAAPPTARALVAGSSLCNGVKPSQVAAVLGHPVPAPTASSSSNSSNGITSTMTACLYAHVTSLASLEQEVGLGYLSFSKAPTKATALAFIKAALKKAQQSKDATWTYTLDNHFGMTNLYATATSKGAPYNFTVTFDVAWSGTKVAEAFAFSRLSKVKIYALEKLAIDNFGM